MKRFTAFLLTLGFLTLQAAGTARAAVLVVSVHDWSTTEVCARLNAQEREASLPEIGDVIDARQDEAEFESRVFGRRECSSYPPSSGGKFVCIEFRGLSYAEAGRMTQPIYHGSASEGLVFTKYRRFRVELDALPQDLQAELYAKGVASLDYLEWRDVILDKEAVR